MFTESGSCVVDGFVRGDCLVARLHRSFVLIEQLRFDPSLCSLKLRSCVLSSLLHSHSFHDNFPSLYTVIPSLSGDPTYLLPAFDSLGAR